MPINCARLLKNITISKDLFGIVERRTFAAGAKKKGSKGDVDVPTTTLSNEVKSSTVVGANILKDGKDPKVMADADYPDWVFHLLDKQPALSELKRKNIETLPYEQLKRYVKLDNRVKIKANNSVKAKK